MSRLRFQRVGHEEAREAHALAFPSDGWCGPLHEFWLVKRDRKLVGFLACSVDERGLYISRIAVVKAAQGMGLGKCIVQFALKFGHRCGYSNAFTYTLLQNYASMCMLLGCGFKFVEPPPGGRYLGKRRVHYFARQL